MNVLDFEAEFLQRNPNRPQILTFMREAIEVRNIVWQDLTRVNLSKISDYICEHVSPNSAFTYLSTLKAFLNVFKEEDGLIPCQSFKTVLAVKKVPSQNVYLTEAEIELIEHYKPKNDCERDVKAAFLIECYLGARRCDVLNLTSDNINDGRIVYVSKKTHVECSVPIHKNLMKYLRHKPQKVRDRAVANRCIQRICKEVGITAEVRIFYHGKLQKRPKYEYVSSHTARRSFCSNLARRGVDIYTIASLAGHNQNIAMTQRYIIPDIDTLSAEAMSFFTQQP